MSFDKSFHQAVYLNARGRYEEAVIKFDQLIQLHPDDVEAWKKIIESYKTKYPGLDVKVFYEGEAINDLNTLFKWGKVKHGSCIQFCVSGENIQDLAKLSRYFRQGASPQFEAFLHGSPDTVMNLF